MSADAREKANLLVATIKSALARGCLHRDSKGNLLNTPLQILDCLVAEGRVEVEEPKGPAS